MADMPDCIGTHTMRKTFGYWYYKQFKDVAELQKILNHSHPEITLKYIGITDEQIENNMRNFVL
jgi:integrase